MGATDRNPKLPHGAQSCSEPTTGAHFLPSFLQGGQVRAVPEAMEALLHRRLLPGIPSFVRPVRIHRSVGPFLHLLVATAGRRFSALPANGIFRATVDGRSQ